MDLLIAGEFAPLIPLLQQQPYLGTITADPAWGLTNWIDAGGSLQQAWQPPTDVSGWDQVYHLGYRRWPELPLPLEAARHARVPPDLARPWITAKPYDLGDGAARNLVTVGFSDCYFELKYGLLELLDAAGFDLMGVMGSGRWEDEGGYRACSWWEAARWIASSKVFLGCCSGLHVLARALGTPVVLYEPMAARLNPIFLPYGTTGHGVELVVGNDGQATTDARHTADTLRKVLDSCA